MAELIIRRATLNDAGAMAAYLTEIGAEKLDTITRRDPISEEQERTFLEKYFANYRAFILLAVADDRVIGTIDMKAHEKRHERHVAELGMGIAKEWLGKGIGRRLLETVIAEARKWDGLCRIELEVVAWNARAIKLYESFGFVTEACKRKAVNFRGKPEDALLMALVW